MMADYASLIRPTGWIAEGLSSEEIIRRTEQLIVELRSPPSA
jgi:hypothetical protein